MNEQTQRRLGPIPLLVAATIVMNAFVMFFFSSIERIVNDDLSKYGLESNPAWANPYNTNAMFILVSIGAALVMSSLSIICITAYSQTGGTSRRKAGIALLFGVAGATAFSWFFLLQLDKIVNVDFYKYGLQPNMEWLNRYWLYIRSTLALEGLTIITSLSSAVAVHLIGKQAKFVVSKLASPLLASFGIAALLFGVYFSSEILALIGMGLVFWAVTVVYVVAGDYVKKCFLEETATSSLVTLNDVLNRLNFEGKAVYASPKYLTDMDDSKIYLLRNAEKWETKGLPREEAFKNDEEGLVLSPPGIGLSKLVEKYAKTSFGKVDIGYVEQRLPRIITKDLEAAQDAQITIENDTAILRVKGLFFNDLCKSIANRPLDRWHLGLPLSSAVACLLAKASGRSLIIESEFFDRERNLLEVKYRFLKQAEVVPA